MIDKEIFKFLNFISENNNFKLKDVYEITEEKFGWQIFLNGIKELENLNLVTENQDGETYSITKLGIEKLSELKINFENSEKDEKAERKKLHNESKLSDWQIKTFWPLFIFGFFGGLYSAYDIIKNLTTADTILEKQVTKEQMELELSKLRTLILIQKKDTLLAHPYSEKGK